MLFDQEPKMCLFQTNIFLVSPLSSITELYISSSEPPMVLIEYRTAEIVGVVVSVVKAITGLYFYDATFQFSKIKQI